MAPQVTSGLPKPLRLLQTGLQLPHPGRDWSPIAFLALLALTGSQLVPTRLF
ncbi:hypothetical protein M404DRAFT_28879 [Pisolithus tinctorius Marx 270]|uniref:Uncharacterized protein n=1 Tax=Pisolithus tinctorius Marx 270 TaxID=870435 RepID=A0A0C3P1I0_PISTI|nr:hypothetical protein M404DRAFT_28879 [Pisolithus tinctorius Marx 270]